MNNNSFFSKLGRKYRRKIAIATLVLLLTGGTVPAVRARGFGTLFDLTSILGFIEGILGESLGISQWTGLFDDFASDDPCDGLPIIFFAPPEPGWCLGGGGIGSLPSGLDSLDDILSDSRGAAGIPNPNKSRSQIEEAIAATDSTPDLFETNPEVYAQYLGNTVDRANTKMAIETVLGEGGQQQLETERESTEEAVEAAVKTADGAQSLNVTQDAIKEIAKIEAQQTILMGSIRADSLRNRVDNQFRNLNLVNISRTVDEANRSRRVELSAQGAKAMYMSAQVNLF